MSVCLHSYLCATCMPGDYGDKNGLLYPLQQEIQILLAAIRLLGIELHPPNARSLHSLNL